MKVDEILERLVFGSDDGENPNDSVRIAKSSLLSHILAEMPKKDGYGKGVCVQIGALLMHTDGMREGFAQFKSLKEIERQRNMGYNQALDDVINKLKDLFDADPR
jgi:hypothetical protein